MTAAKPVKPAREPSEAGPGAPAGDSDGPALRVVPDPDAGLPPVPEPADPESLAGYASLLEELKAERDEQRRKHDQLELEAKALWTQGEQDASKERRDQAADSWMEQLDADAQAAELAGAYLTEHPGAVPMFRDALLWFLAGWAPLPIKLDGSKAPLVADWRQYHGAGNGPTLAQVLDWFRKGHPGLAVMLGAVSGNRVMLEFEARGVQEGYRDRWLGLLRERGHAELADRYLTGLLMSSPSGGLNGFIRIDSAEPAGSERLISRERTPEEAAQWREANGKDDSAAVPHLVLAEIKGDRGYALVWPSHGPVHATGKPYRLIVGSPETDPVFTEAEFAILCETARELSPVKEKPRRTRMEVREGRPVIRDWSPLKAGGAGALRGERPGDHYNRVLGRDGFLDFMLAHGWGYVWTEDDGPYCGEHYIRRPGKDSGTSASIGNPQHEGLYPKLHVFSTSAAPFEAETGYDAFGAFALLHHDGDISAAAGALRAQGYGWDERRRGLRLGTLGKSKQQRGPDDETETFHCLLRVIRDQWLPGVYHHGGQLVEAQPGHGGRIEYAALDATRILALLATHTRPYLDPLDDDNESVPYLPSAQLVNMVRSEREWGTLPELKGILTAPVLRPDGSILQTDGYDQQTGYWLASEVEIEVPETPSPADVAEAKALILDQVLADFPWGTPASKANAVAMMFTPHLRPYLGALAPFFPISASQPGTGKGLLCTIVGTPYGMTTQTMADSTEMRKTIPTLLGDTAEPVIVLDNIEKPLRSPDLAAVLTMKYWSSRFLSRNKLGTFLNDRTWIGNGNQLQLASDMPRRSILIDLNYPYENPAARTGFKIKDMTAWLESNRATLLRAQLILLRAWILAGAEREDSQVMGSYMPWVQAMGGFLKFLGVKEFRANQDQVHAHDQGGDELGVLFRAWREVFGARFVAAHDVREMGTTGGAFSESTVAIREELRGSTGEAAAIGRLRAAYPLAERTDRPLAVQGLGRYLKKVVGRWAGGHTLLSGYDERENATYAVMNQAEAEAWRKENSKAEPVP